MKQGEPAMTTAKWIFRKKYPLEKERNPIAGEYFDEEAIEGPAQALVRESIQNALDAQDPHSPSVRVLFYVSEGRPLARDVAQRWFEGLWPHLTAPGSGLRGVPEMTDACRFLVVEDFGTRGLEGDFRARDSASAGSDNRFYAFFRAEGLSQNDGGRGKWGVGKTVFPRSSRINTMFGFTIRRSDNKPLLMGQAVLRYHQLQGAVYAPDGMFGCPDSGPPEVVLPVEDSAAIEEFCQAFCLERGKNGEPGLSVVVPFCHDDVTPEAIVRAVVREYFLPILDGKLTVSVESPGSSVLLDQGSLPNLARSASRGIDESLSAVIQFAFDARKIAPQQLVSLAAPAPAAKPRWDKSLFPPDQLNSLSTQFTRGDLIALRVPVKVQKLGAAPEDSHFDVFLRRDLKGRGYRPIFVRNGITIPRPSGREPRRVGGHNLFALVVIDDKPLAGFLGDAETPAHTDWSHDTGNFRGKYQDGRQLLDFVRTSPRNIAEILSQSDAQRDRRSLAEFFPAFPEPEQAPPVEGPGRKPGQAPEAPETHDIEKPRPQPWRIENVHAGFRIVRDNAGKVPLPAALTIEVAYDTTRGNPLSRYDPADFDLSDGSMTIVVADAEITRRHPNLLCVRPSGDKFLVEVTGFDENRDLYVSVTEEKPDVGPADAAASAGKEA